ncbi:MAG: hypothetical protein ACREM8_02695 [Vulcanimicrobiaceae bacterium]
MTVHPLVVRAGWVCSLLLVLSALRPQPAAAGPVFDAFKSAVAAIDDYTVTIAVHETDGHATEDRVYTYSFKRPHYAKIAITAGAGRGGGAVWTGGDTLTGHQGGMLSFLKLKINIHDRRAVSLIGDTIDEASLPALVEHLATVPGTLTERAGPAIGGLATDEIRLDVTDPKADRKVTRELLFVSPATHLPMRRQRYEDTLLVKQEDFSGFKLNVGLTAADF